MESFLQLQSSAGALAASTVALPGAGWLPAAVAAAAPAAPLGAAQSSTGVAAALAAGVAALLGAGAGRRPGRRCRASRAARQAAPAAVRRLSGKPAKAAAASSGAPPPWRRYSGDWEVHKFGGASLNTAELYKTCGELLRNESHRHGPGVANVPTAAIVSATGGMTDALVAVVTTSVKDPTEAEGKMRACAQRQIDMLLELVPDQRDLTDPVIARIQHDANGVSAMLTAVKLMRGVPPQMVELVAGLGEVWSAQTLAAYLQSVGEPCDWVDARDVLLVPETDGGLGEKGQALETIVPLWDKSTDLLKSWWESKFGDSGGSKAKHISKWHNKAPFIIVTGFVCSTPTGRPTTLKRSGSDYSATIFAKILGAVSVTMWKNVNGVYTADPRRVPDAFSIPTMTFDEAMELAYFGGQVLHPSAMIPCMDERIPVLVRNVFNPSHPGTKVYGRGDAWLRWDDQEDDPLDQTMPVKALTSIEKVALVTLAGASFLGTHGVARRMMEALANAGVSVILTSQGSSEHSITVAVDESQVDIAAKGVEEAFSMELSKDTEIRVTAKRGCSIIAVIGEGMKNTPNVSGRFFSALGRAKCNVVAIAQGSSERNISAVVLREDLSRALRAAHAGFTLSQITVAIGIIGAGKVGTQLLDQLSDFKKHLTEKNAKVPALAELRGLNLEVRAVCDADKMLLADHGLALDNIPLDATQAAVDVTGLAAAQPKERAKDIKVLDTDLKSLEEFIDTKQIPHKILIDCTASDEVADMYEGWLRRGIHVISPNKKLGAGDLKRYRRCMELTRNSSAMWFYDSTVGAQLPIISMLHDILQTGDAISKVEGSLSGTFGYCIDKLERNPGMQFSDAIVGARDADLLEPDPMDDLTGRDTARKALIIARELGLELELEDVKVESILKNGNGSASTPEGWEWMLKGLREHADGFIAQKLKEAKEKGLRLRYVSEIDVNRGTVSVGFRCVNEEHPLAQLRDNETVVSVVSDRYTSNTPLVLRGRGAGSEVTASGVFATVLRLSRRLGS